MALPAAPWQSRLTKKGLPFKRPGPAPKPLSERLKQKELREIKRIQRRYPLKRKIEVLVWLMNHKVKEYRADRAPRCRPGHQNILDREHHARHGFWWRFPTYDEAATFWKIPQQTIRGWWEQRKELLEGTGIELPVNPPCYPPPSENENGEQQDGQSPPASAGAENSPSADTPSANAQGPSPNANGTRSPSLAGLIPTRFAADAAQPPPPRVVTGRPTPPPLRVRVYELPPPPPPTELPAAFNPANYVVVYIGPQPGPLPGQHCIYPGAILPVKIFGQPLDAPPTSFVSASPSHPPPPGPQRPPPPPDATYINGVVYPDPPSAGRPGQHLSHQPSAPNVPPNNSSPASHPARLNPFQGRPIKPRASYPPPQYLQHRPNQAQHAPPPGPHSTHGQPHQVPHHVPSPTGAHPGQPRPPHRARPPPPPPPPPPGVAYVGPAGYVGPYAPPGSGVQAPQPPTTHPVPAAPLAWVSPAVQASLTAATYAAPGQTTGPGQPVPPTQAQTQATPSGPEPPQSTQSHVPPGPGVPPVTTQEPPTGATESASEVSNDPPPEQERKPERTETPAPEVKRSASCSPERASQPQAEDLESAAPASSSAVAESVPQEEDSVMPTDDVITRDEDTPMETTAAPKEDPAAASMGATTPPLQDEDTAPLTENDAKEPAPEGSQQVEASTDEARTRDEDTSMESTPLAQEDTGAASMETTTLPSQDEEDVATPTDNDVGEPTSESTQQLEASTDYSPDMDIDTEEPAAVETVNTPGTDSHESSDSIFDSPMPTPAG